MLLGDVFAGLSVDECARGLAAALATLLERRPEFVETNILGPLSRRRARTGGEWVAEA